MSKRPIALKVGNALLCDDIRREANNKLIIIGVYSSDVILSSAPTEIRLCLFAELFFATAGPRTIEITYSLDGRPLAGLTANIDVSEPSEPTIIATPALPVQFHGSGQFKIEAKVGGGRATTVLTKRVRVGEVPA